MDIHTPAPAYGSVHFTFNTPSGKQTSLVSFGELEAIRRAEAGNTGRADGGRLICGRYLTWERTEDGDVVEFCLWVGGRLLHVEAVKFTDLQDMIARASR